MRGVIEQKRDGAELDAQTCRDVVDAYTAGLVDDAQMAALCMACLWKGLSLDETVALTGAMAHSGRTLHFDPANGLVADKHSTGGVSDIVSLVAVPLAAACGVKIAKLSGRALGHTGGTIDKLEAIPGFNVALSPEAFVAQVERIGCAISSQSADLAPADKRIYALRDRTGTVPSMGLIVASIVSKKIAGGAHAFVFDVKTGPGAFMREQAQAQMLADLLVAVAQRFERRALAHVTGMNEPLGRSIGTGIEAIEAREFLRGNADPHARKTVLDVAATLVGLRYPQDAMQRVQRALADGSAYAKFTQMIDAQGGDVRAFEQMQLGDALAIASPASGTVQAIDVIALGNMGRTLSAADPLGGLRMDVRLGESVSAGQPLCNAYGSARTQAASIATAFSLSR